MNPARLVLPAVRWATNDGFAGAEEDARRALERGVGGFIVFGGPAAEVARLTDSLTRLAGRPLLFAADLERGAGQQFEGLTHIPSAGALGELSTRQVVRQAGYVTATEARSVGVNLVLAPVADLDSEPANPIVQSRSFGADPVGVAQHVVAWVDGCQAGGCWACAKHYPGHGRTTTDSHATAPAVAATVEELERTDLIPFRAAIDQGVATVMTAHVRYPSLDSSDPATFSRAVIDHLRGPMSFDGAVLTDALIMEGAKGRCGAGEAAVKALSAGVDLLLYPEELDETVASLERASQEGSVAPERLASAEARYRRLLADLPGAAPPANDARSWSEHLADELLERGLVRGRVGSLADPIDCRVIDDDLGGPYPPGPTDIVARALNVAGDQASARIVLVFAEPRGWKGRAGLGEESLAALARATPTADLLVLFGHPRLLEQLPDGPPVLVAWNRQPLMQEAVVRWLRRAGT